MQNLVDAASKILDVRYREHWEQIESVTGETAQDLLQSVDKYLATLTLSQRDTYTNPFEVVADNMGMQYFFCEQTLFLRSKTCVS